MSRLRVVVGAVVAVSLLLGATPAIAAPSAAGAPGGGRDATEVPLLRSEAPERPVAEGAAPVAWSPAPPPEDRDVSAIPVPERELVDRRDAYTRVYENTDGSLTIDAYTAPIHYETPEGWAPIDNTVAPDPERPGWVVADDNRWTTAFGSAQDGVRLETSAGAIQMTPVAAAGSESEPPSADSAPVAERPASDRAPQVEDRAERSSEGPERAAAIENVADEPGVVTYREVWPGVDLRYEVSATGVKEEVIVAGPGAGNEFTFDLTGAALQLRADGGVDLAGALGDVFEIPAPTVLSADGSDVTGGSGARFELRPASEEGVQRLAVVVDPAWLASLPPESFPVRIDPSFILLDPTSAITYASNNQFFTGTPIAIGRHSSGFVYRAGLRFGQYEPYLTGGWRVYNAQLQFGGQTDSSPPITVYDQGAQPTSFASIGTSRPVVEGQWDGPFLNVSKEMDRWVTQGLAGRWFGVRTVETGVTYRTPTVRLILYVFQPPQPSFVTNLSDQQVLSSTTPTLRSQPVPFAPDDPPVHPWHEFQITTSPAPNSGLVLSSGMIEQTSESQGVSWTVPQGTLQEGLTYWAWVLTDFPQYGGPPPATSPAPELGRRFTVDLGLGEGGPSPTDEVGSVYGSASLPSEGAPGPSLPGSKVTVNLVDGNLSMSTGTRTMGSLSGGIALGFTYNSLALGNRGLNAEFFNDTNGSGSIDGGDVQVASRVDPTVNFDWGYGTLAKPVAAIDPTKALGRWTGVLTVPSATTRTWQLGAVSSDGLRASVNGTVRLDQWSAHEPQAAPEFGTSFTASSAAPLPLSIEWRNSLERGVARVYLRDVTSPSSPITYNLSPAWLTRQVNSLPPGWTLNAAAGSARWVGLQDRGTSVSVYAGDGTAHEFKAAGNGSYTPPVDAPNDLLTLGDNGRYVLRDAAGNTYTFRADGTLESLVSASDDRNPAAVTYTYAGTPVRLRTITDPVSGRSVNLSYGGDAACSGAPAAAVGFLCDIEFWDGAATTLTYDTNGRFVRLTNPGGIVQDFAYDSAGRLTHIRDPLAYDAIAAGLRADDINARTQIAYNANGTVSAVTQPAPAAGALRPQRTYTYDAINRTGKVDVAGFAPTVGFAQRTRYDTRNRIVESTDSAGLNTTYSWDALDRLLATTDPAGVRSTTEYDYASRPVRSYGPAPSGSFQANGLPVAGATVPTTARVYDGGISGLAAAYWTNPNLAGGPALHDTGLGAGGEMDRDWGISPPVTPGAGGWSARYSGHFTVTTAGSYLFQGSTKGSSAKVWVDDVLVVDHNQPEPPGGYATTTGSAVSLTAGPHRVRVDMVDTTGPAGLRVLWKPAASGSFTVLPGSALSPGYGLETSTTDPDGKVAATEYIDAGAGIGPHYGLATATVLDPAGVNLRTAIAYEAPGAGSFLRRTARTLPAGNTWTTVNYGGTEGPVAAVCGVPAGTPQGGQPKRITGPDPDGAGPAAARVEEFVYDTIGRQVGRLEATTTTLAGAGWECTTYDTRGRMAAQSWPAHLGAAARTVSYTYAVGGNPFVNQVSEPASGAISGTVDLLGRTTGYTDVWGATTTTTYDQPGRMTSTVGPLGTTVYNFAAATGRPTTTVLNGTTLATPSYNATTGRLSSVGYGNGAGTTQGYDNAGRVNQIGVNDTTATTGDVVTYSPGGRVIDQQIYREGTGFVDANPAGGNYVYDGAGRLVSAQLPGTTYGYGYGPAPGCTATGAGANTNRTSLTVTGAGATAYCYNAADQLESLTGTPAAQVAYDDHGNTTTLGAESFDFDAADRHVRTETATSVTRYLRDPLDRIAGRTGSTRITHVGTTSATSATAAAVAVSRPSGTQAGDVMVATVSAAGTVGAPGGVSAAGWSLAADRTNLTGRTFVLWREATASDPPSWTFSVANASGVTGALVTYRNVDTDRPLTAVATAVSTAQTSHPLPQVTTDGDARHLVHVVGFALSAAAFAPGGTDQRAKITTAPSLLVMDRYQSRPGTSSALAATTGLPQTSVSATVALAPKITTPHVQISQIGAASGAAAAANVSVNRPTGTKPGDVILAAVTARGAVKPGNLTAPGWALVADTSTALFTRTYLLWRYATAGDPASWTFTAPNATNTVAALTTYRGASPNGPIAAIASSTGSGTSHPFPQVTTRNDGSYLTHVLGVEANTTPTAPAGTTSRANLGNGIGAAGASMLVADRAMPTAGTSTSVSATTPASTTAVRFTVAFQPAVTTARYGYSGHTDNPQFILDITGGVTDAFIPLPGNTTYTRTPTGITYSHANIHGDTVTITDNAANRIWSGYSGPYGEATYGANPPNTSIPNTTWRSLAQQQRLTDGNTIHMGARPYNPTHGRFLTIDPIEGGCANPYVYGFGDPTNGSDISGTEWWDPRDWGDEIAGFVSKCVRGFKSFVSEPELGVGVAAGAILTGGIVLEGIAFTHLTAALTAAEAASLALVETGLGIVIVVGVTAIACARG